MFEVSRLEAAGGSVLNVDPATLPDTDADGNAITLDQRKGIARDAILANYFLDKVSDQFAEIIRSWRLRASDGIDEFPKTPEQAFQRLLNQRELLSKAHRASSGRNVAFAALENYDEGPDDDNDSTGPLKGKKPYVANFTRQRRRSGPPCCYFCGKPGHRKLDCPKLQAEIEASRGKTKISKYL